MAEANRDEAYKSYHLSQNFFAQNEYELAVKYAEKAVKLYSTPELVAWCDKARQSLSSQPASSKISSNNSDTCNGADTKTCAEPSNATESSPLYTPDQAKEVKLLLKVNRDDFYAVLGLQKDASETEIKKSYRKLALQFHPDKNHAAGADEAFKVVSRAFSCLSDPEKKAQYDKFGCESTNGMPNGFSAMKFNGNHFKSSQFETDISPEDLFNMFFGGGMGGNSGFTNFSNGSTPFGPINFQSFGGSRGFTQFSSGSSPFGPINVQRFGGNGGFANFSSGSSPFGPLNFQSFGGNPFSRRRRRNHPDPPFTWLAAAIQMFPLVIMGIIVFLANWLNSTNSNP